MALTGRVRTTGILLVLGCFARFAAAQTVQITATAPTVSIQPGDSVQFQVSATYSGAPFRATLKLVLKETSEAGTKEIDGGVSGTSTAGTLILPMSYNVPHRACNGGSFWLCTENGGVANFAASLKKISSLQLVVKMFDNGGREIASASRDVGLTYPEIASVSSSGQPMESQSTQYIRLVARDTKFTNVDSDGVGVSFHFKEEKEIFGFRAGDKLGNWAACEPLPRGVWSGGCEARILDDTTLEFKMRTVTPAANEAEVLRRVGPQDVRIFWREKSKPAPEIAYRMPDALKPGAYAFTAPVKDDMTNLKRLDVVVDPNNPDPKQRQSYTLLPGVANTLVIDRDVVISVKWGAEYRLSRLGEGKFWVMIREKGKPSNLFQRDLLVWNSLGETSDFKVWGGNSDGFTGPPTYFLRLPPWESDLEFFTCMTRLGAESPNEECFAASDPIVVSHPNLTVDRVELVQAVQDEANGVPLVAGKTTVARVFVGVNPLPNGSPPTAGQNPLRVPGVSAVLRAFRSGTELPGSPQKADNAPITALSRPERANEAHSLNFSLPRAWTEEGSLTLEAEVNPEKTVGESGTSDNKKTESVRFTKRNGLRIAYAPVCYLTSAACPTAAILNYHKKLARLFPLADDALEYRKLSVPRLTWRKGLQAGRQNINAWQTELVSGLRQRYDFIDAVDKFSADQFVGWLPEFSQMAGVPTPPLGISDPVWVGSTGRVSFAQETASLDAAGTRALDSDSAFTLAHEVAHNLGLRHSNTADACGARDPDTDWPHPTARIQDLGFDPDAMKVLPNSKLDLMSYCSPPGSNIWISPFSFKKLFNGNLSPRKRLAPAMPAVLASVGPGPRTAALPGAPPGNAARAEYLIITGSARRDGSAGSLNLGYRVTSLTPGEPSNPVGNHCVRLSGSSGSPVAHCFDLEFVEHRSHEPIDQESFALKIPFPSGTTQAALVRGGRELAVLRASAQTPALEIINPRPADTWSDTRTLSWSPFDADGDRLTYAVLYSPDGGDSWLPLDVDLTDPALTVDTSEIASGSRIYFQVLATDGLNTGAATIGPITVVRSSNVRLTPMPLDFGDVKVGESKTLTLEVANIGNQPFTVGRITSSSPQFLVTAPLAAFGLSADGRQAVTVRFAASAAGSQTGTLTLSTTDPAQPTLSVPLAARGVTSSAPRLELSASALDYGPVEVNSSRDLALVIRNKGTAALRIQSASTDDPRFGVIGPSLPVEIAADGSALLQVRFAPTAEGTRAAILRFDTSDAARATATVALTGTGAGNPTIAAIDPAEAAPGASITISGRNFSTVPADNMVRFGSLGVRASTASPTQITATVPAELAAGESPVAVVVSGRPSNTVRFLVASPSGSAASTRKHFAHFGSGGGLVSSVVLTNPFQTRTATGSAFFFGDQGQTLNVSVNGAPPSGVSAFAIPPLGSVTLSSDSTGAVATGSVKVETSSPVGGFVKFAVPGLGIAGVGESTPSSSVLMPVVRDAALGLNTGVAISSAEAIEQNVVFSLRGLDGRQVDEGSAVLSLAPNGHVAKFVDELFPAADISKFEGTLVVSATSGRKLAATALQVGRSAGEFTTLPVVAIDPVAAAANLAFAQFGNGAGLTSSLFLVNPLNTPITGEASFFNDAGAPAAISINGGPASERFPFAIPPLGGAVLRTDGAGPSVSGSARVAASDRVGGVLRFALPGAGIAGVGTSSSMSGFVTPVRRSIVGGRSTGVAIAAEANVQLTAILRDAGGVEVPQGRINLALPFKGHRAQFIQELFPQADTREFSGTLTVSAAEGTIVATALELGSSPGEFTTLPVTPLAESPAAANPAPVISSLDPSSITAGNSGFTLIVYGREFVSGATVRWNGADRPTTFSSSTMLQTSISAADVASPGVAAISVFNPAPGGGASNALSFSVAASPVQTPTISVSPASLDFGTVTAGQSRDLALTVRNTGSAALRVDSIVSSSAPFTVPAPPIPFTVVPAAQQTVTVRFAPVSAGVYVGTVAVASDDPNRPSVSVPVSGTGAAAAAPRIEVNPTALDFGTVVAGQTKDATLTVRNTGAAPLSVSSISSSDAAFSVLSPAPPFTVAPGGQQAVTVRFAPGTAGSQSATLSILSNDPAGASSVVLAGTAVLGSPAIGVVTVTRLDNDSARIDIQLSDPAGDVVKIDYAFFRGGVQQSTRAVNSPADVNLAGFTSGTVSRTFTGIGVSTPFGTVLPDRVDIEATDSLGARSNKVSKSF